MKYPKKKIIAELVGIVFIGMIVFAPGVISGYLEPIETGSDSIVPSEKVIMNSSSNTTYEPYIEYNTETLGTLKPSGNLFVGNYFGIATDLDTRDINYNVDGYWDSLICPYTSIEDFYYIQYLEVDGTDLLSDNIKDWKFQIDAPCNYEFYRIQIYGSDSAFVPEDWLVITPDNTRYGIGLHTYNLDMNSYLNDIATTHQNYEGEHAIIMFGFRLIGGLSVGDEILTNLIMVPEYFEVHTTTYNNQTVTTYKPFIQSISNPFHWTQILMGIGGVIIGSVAVFSLPQVNLNLPNTQSGGSRKK